MELFFKDLQERDVINVVDGKCLGRIIDIRLSFPEGVLTGIVVPGRKLNWFFKLFDRTQVYIDQSKIKKIGGDVVLVELNCGDVCTPNVRGSIPPYKPPCSTNICSPCGENETPPFNG